VTANPPSLKVGQQEPDLVRSIDSGGQAVASCNFAEHPGGPGELHMGAKRLNRGLTMRMLVDGDPVIVFGRTVELAGTGELKLEPWDPSTTPAHRRDGARVHSYAVPLTGWPAETSAFDIADPKLVWRIEGTWHAGNTIAFGSWTMVQDPWGQHFAMDAEDRSTRPVKNMSPFDDGQLRELKRLREEEVVLTTRVRRDPSGEKVFDIVAFDQQEASRAMGLRPDQRVRVVQAEWNADSVRRTREAIREGTEQWPVLSSGQRNGADGEPFAFTLRVGWLNRELLQLYETTPPGLLALDVWLGPAADRTAAA